MAKDKKQIKKQREDVFNVVEKWRQKEFSYSSKARDEIGRNTIVGFAGGTTAASMLADLFLTGGMVTVCSLGFGMLSGGYLAAAACNEGETRRVDWENKAGQVISSDPFVRLALEGMQIKLSDKFNASSAAKGAEKTELEFEFKQMAKDVRQDLDVLKTSYAITDGGEKKYGTDQFEFEISAVKTKEVVTKGAVTLGSVVNDNTQENPLAKKTTRHNRSFDI